MRARPAYWLVLALAIGGSVALRALVARAAADDWQPAVYRYPADGLPACADLTGHAAPTLRPAGRWLRAGLPQALRWSPRGCVLREQTPT